MTLNCECSVTKMFVNNVCIETRANNYGNESLGILNDSECLHMLSLHATNPSSRCAGSCQLQCSKLSIAMVT